MRPPRGRSITSIAVLAVLSAGAPGSVLAASSAEAPGVRADGSLATPGDVGQTHEAAEPSGAFTPTGLVVFLTDFGLEDDAVALCKGVMLSVDATLRIVDLTHDVTPYDIDEGAFYLAEAADTFPPGTIFVGVIDPGVGTDRRAVVIQRDDGQVFVVPDNGLASAALAGGRMAGAWEITDPRFQAKRPSATFHGRDLFAPAGALLAAGGARPEDAGPPVRDLVGRDRPLPLFEKDTFRGTVELLDKSFGNVWTNLTRAGLEEAFPSGITQLRVVLEGHDLRLPLVRTFGDVSEGAPLAYFNSRDRLSLAINQGSFADHYGVEPGDQVRVSAAEGDPR